MKRILIPLLALAAAMTFAQPPRPLPPGYPDRSGNIDLERGFRTPPAGYGEVPFYWWIGDTLTREHLAWQLDMLARKRISSLQINYCHTDTGGITYGRTFRSKPDLFTPAWWELFGWFMTEAGKRGMTVSLSDYTLGVGQGSYVDEMLAEDPSLPDMEDQAGQDRCYERAMNEILDGIKADLADFRVEHQHWFSEKTLVESGAVKAAFDALTEAGHTFDKDGAFWFATQALGDDKDRVLRKSDGSLTYFASDIAYHHNKFQRGYDWLIDIWGADHHGYVPRMRAAITAMGKPRESFDVVLIQLVNLLQGGKPVSMSTRAGTFETLADVVKEVGADAARFMFLSRKSDTSLDFDLELAKQRSLDNPVYYVQYAHARICAVLRRAEERGITLPAAATDDLLAALDTPEDMALLRKMAGFEDMVATAAQALAVHHVSHYLMDLAGMLHSYYAKHQVLLADDTARTLSRLALLRAVSQVLRNGLDLLGVSAPEAM